MGIKQPLNFFRGVATNQMKFNPDTPDFRLGIAAAEDLSSKGVTLNYIVGQNKAVLPDTSMMAYEQTAVNGVGDGLKTGDFSADYSETVNIWAAIEGARAYGN